MHFENTILTVNGEIQLGNLILAPDCIKSKSLHMIITDDKMELKNMKFIKNGGYIEVNENEVDFKNSRVQFLGEVIINEIFNSKNGVISIYDGIMNFENSQLQIGGFQATKDGVTHNKTSIKFENSSFIKNNMIIKDDKIEHEIINSSIILKNSQFNYAYDGIDRIYFQVNATGRVLYYDINKNYIYPFSVIPYGMSTALLGNRMEIVKTADGLQYLYIMRHSSNEMWRCLIYY